MSCVKSSKRKARDLRFRPFIYWVKTEPPMKCSLRPKNKNQSVQHQFLREKKKREKKLLGDKPTCGKQEGDISLTSHPQVPKQRGHELSIPTFYAMRPSPISAPRSQEPWS